MCSFCHSVPCSMPSEDLQTDKMNICFMNILFVYCHDCHHMSCKGNHVCFVVMCQCLHEMVTSRALHCLM